MDSPMDPSQQEQQQQETQDQNDIPCLTSTTMPSTTTTVLSTNSSPSTSSSFCYDPFLPKSMARSYEICHVLTDAWIQIFQDDDGLRLLVGITQRQQKIGTWIWCQMEKSSLWSSSSGHDSCAPYQWSTVLGSSSSSCSSTTGPRQHGHPVYQNETWLGLYGRAILEGISKHTSATTNPTFRMMTKVPTKLLLGISLLPMTVDDDVHDNSINNNSDDDNDDGTNHTTSTTTTDHHHPMIMFRAIVQTIVQMYVDLMGLSN